MPRPDFNGINWGVLTCQNHYGQTEQSTIISVTFDNKGTDWSGIYLNRYGVQTVSSDLAEYGADRFKPISWVLFEDAKVYGPKGWVYCPQRGLIVDPAKVAVVDLMEPVASESFAKWQERHSNDPNFKSLMSWDGYVEFARNVWRQFRGEAGLPKLMPSPKGPGVTPSGQADMKM
jgi:hypothetical protein